MATKGALNDSQVKDEMEKMVNNQNNILYIFL